LLEAAKDAKPRMVRLGGTSLGKKRKKKKWRFFAALRWTE